MTAFKEEAIELWQCIQAHAAVKQIGKVLTKHDIEDYIVFIRTRHNTFLHGLTSYSDVTKQIAHLIENAAADMGLSSNELAENIKVTIYKRQKLQIALEEVFEEKDTLSPEEYKDKIRETFRLYEVDEDEINDMMRHL